MSRTIVMFNYAETRGDPRVRRVAQSLAHAGDRVVVIGQHSPGLPASEQLGPIEIVRVPGPRLPRRSDMAEIDRLCSEAGDVLRRSDPRVMDAEPGTAHRVTYKLVRRAEKALDWVAIRTGTRLFTGSRHPRSETTELMRMRSLLLTNLAFYREAARHKPDIVHSNDLDTLLAGYLVKKLHGVPLVYDAHEIYSEQFAAGTRTALWHRFFENLERAMLPETDARMTVCDSLGNYFVERRGSRPFATIRNVPSLRHLADPAILERKNRPRRILYHGAYFEHRGLDQIIAAARFVEGACFVFRGLGYHEAELRRLVRVHRVEDRVQFAPPVRVDELVDRASECDIGLNPFVSVCLNTEYSLPNKFFEYMMAGLAIVSSDLVELRKNTEAYGVGALMASLDAEAIAESLTAVVAETDRLDTWRRNAHARAKEECHWELEELRLYRLYDTLR